MCPANSEEIGAPEAVGGGRGWLRTGWLGLALLTTLACATSAGAQPATEVPARKPPNPAAALRQRIESMPLPPSGADRAELLGLLASGQADSVTDAALTALGTTRGPEAVETLYQYCDHRRPAARVAALRALAEQLGDNLGGAERSPIEQRLTAALSDPHPDVRNVAAETLGAHRVAAAAPALLEALERGVPGAAEAAGRLATVAQLPRFQAQLGRQPLSQLLPGMRALLTRRDLPAAARAQLLGQLGELAGPEVGDFLDALIDEGALGHGALSKQATALRAQVRAGLRSSSERGDRPTRQDRGGQ